MLAVAHSASSGRLPAQTAVTRSTLSPQTPVALRRSSRAERRIGAPVHGLGRLGDLVKAMGGDAGMLRAEQAALAVPLLRVTQHASLFLEGAPLTHLHVVRAGVLRCVKTECDGYEQVVSFATQGEVLGFDALCVGRQPVGAQALEESSAYALPLAELRALRLQAPALDHALVLALSRQMVRAAATAEMMAAVAADVRLARFLLWMSARMGELGRSPRRLRLPMCRRDVASFLGVAHETVSRSFGALAASGCLAVDNREVEILDLPQLEVRARSTRHAGDEPPATRGPARPRCTSQPSWFGDLGERRAASD